LRIRYETVLEGGIGLKEWVVRKKAVTEGGRGLEERVVWREAVTEGEEGWRNGSYGGRLYLREEEG
jgi:hypothetical protein